MPLSEHEQRLLDEMERNLYGGDADVVTPRSGRANYRFITLGALVALAGVGLMIGGVMSQIIALGLLGFVVVFAGVLLASRPSAAGAKESSTASAATSRRGQARMTFMQRMEKQWDDRQDGRM